MTFIGIFSVGGGAAIGALLRWWLSLTMNHIFPTLPLGTFVANIIGGLLMGLFMGISRNSSIITEACRLCITTGFLGGLTTFSTFSAEAVTLLSHQEYIWASLHVTGHVIGTILATIAGIYTIKLFS
jgi:fluoride exporter